MKNAAVSVGPSSGTASSTKITGNKSGSRGHVLQKIAASSSPPIVDLRGGLPNCSSLTADENDVKKNVISHLSIVSAAINGDSKALVTHQHYQSYKASLNAELNSSLGEVVAKVVENNDLAGVFFENRRKNTQKTDGLMATLRCVNKTLRDILQVPFMKLKEENESILNAPRKKTCLCKRGAGALGRRLNLS